VAAAAASTCRGPLGPVHHCVARRCSPAGAPRHRERKQGKAKGETEEGDSSSHVKREGEGERERERERERGRHDGDGGVGGGVGCGKRGSVGRDRKGEEGELFFYGRHQFFWGELERRGSTKKGRRGSTGD